MLSLALALVILVVTAVLFYQDWRAFGRNRSEVARARKVLELTENLTSGLVDAESGQRGFLLTGETRYLESYHRWAPRVPEILERLADATDELAQHALVSQLRPFVSAKLAELEETVALRSAGNLEGALAIVRTDRGLQAMNRVHALTAELTQHAYSRLTEAASDAQMHADRTRLTIGLGCAILVALLILATVTIERATNRREQLIAELDSAKQNSEQIREQLHTTLRSIGDGVISTDAAGRVTFLNPVAESLTGWTQSQAVGHPLIEVFSIINEKTRETVENPVTKVLAQNRIVGLANGTILVRRDGREIPIDDSGSPIRDGRGRIVGVVLTFRDISERKRVEAERRAFEDQLRQTAKLESLGVLAGGIAHDFNNLLVGILGNASLALDSVSSVSTLRPMLQEVIRASERAAHLTQQMLAYSGKGRFIVQPVDLSELVREIASLVQTSIPRTVQLHLNLAVNLPPIEADVAQLQQLIMNLVINGAEACEDRPGNVTVTTRVQQIDEDHLRIAGKTDQLTPGPHVCLEVRDNGCGMDEATQARIFDPFFTTKFTGRGLGLAAALGIVRGHNAAISIQSEVGRGTSFTVLFPAATESAAGRLAPAPLVDLHGAGTILVIDDEEVVRRTAKLSLERYGYNVVLADNGQTALETLRTGGVPIALVLLDLTMPVMSGEQTLGQLKQMRPGVPVILSSGFAESEATHRFAGKGLAGFIQKPYSSNTLAKKIKGILEHMPRAASG